MEKISSFFKSSRGQKWIGLVLLIIILIAIPLTLSQVSTQQRPTQQASNTHTGGAQDFPCGPVTIKVFANEMINNSTSPNQCTSGSVTNLTSYRTDFWIGLENGSSGSYTAKWTISKNFCSSPQSPCVSAQSNVPGSGSLPASPSTGWQSPNIGSACGFYQDDISFQIFDSSGAQVCQWGDMNNPATGNYNGLSNAYYSICKATDASGSPAICSVPTNTPPPATPTNTPSPTVPIDTPTDTPVPTDTPTPGLTITPTDTPNPSETPTDTPNPSDTPTPTNNPTATPTVIAYNPPTTPKPTLPPTGPGNTFVAVGAIGLIIAVAGLMLAIGL